MEFTPFTIIAGANASGKSNLFDALKFLAKAAETDNLKKALIGQRGEFMELFTQYTENNFAKEMTFVVEMLVNRIVKDGWGNEKELKYTRLRYELKINRYTNHSGIEDLEVTWENLLNLKHKEDKWISIVPELTRAFWRPKVDSGKRGVPYLLTELENGIPTVLAPQDGTTGNKRRFPLNRAVRTVLSSFDLIEFPHVLAAREEMKSWRFLEFNPEDLRQPTSKNTGDDKLSQSGKNLAAVLFRIRQNSEYSLIEIGRKLQKFLPNFIKVEVKDDFENKQYLITLIDKDKKKYTSRVLSEGTLRILALCILEHDDAHTGLLCFEEPENGIHPFRIGDIARLLKGLSADFSNIELPLRQVIVNTHSPVLINQIYNWQYDATVSIWFAEIKNRVAEIDGTRIALNITSILPVDKNQQESLILSEQDKKLTIARVAEYLKTTSNPS